MNVKMGVGMTRIYEKIVPYGATLKVYRKPILLMITSTMKLVMMMMMMMMTVTVRLIVQPFGVGPKVYRKPILPTGFIAWENTFHSCQHHHCH